MGVPSIGILLHEVIKLMYHAKCKDPVFIRLGTCGGVGIEGGTLVVSDEAVDGLLRNTYEMVRSEIHKSSHLRHIFHIQLVRFEAEKQIKNLIIVTWFTDESRRRHEKHE